MINDDVIVCGPRRHMPFVPNDRSLDQRSCMILYDHCMTTPTAVGGTFGTCVFYRTQVGEGDPTV